MLIKCGTKRNHRVARFMHLLIHFASLLRFLLYCNTNCSWFWFYFIYLQPMLVLTDSTKNKGETCHTMYCNNFGWDNKIFQTCDRKIVPQIYTVLVSKYWQRLLDKAMSAHPTRPAKENRLVQMSIYGMARETFDLYRESQMV